MLRAHNSHQSLQSLLALVAAFEDHGLKYVLTGRRTRTEATLAGDGDLDVLVNRDDGARAMRELLAQGFRERPPHPWFRGQAVVDYIGRDEATGLKTHVQLHHELRFGRSVTRSFRLPASEYVTRTSVLAPPVRVPEPAAHLLLHTIKSLLVMDPGGGGAAGPFDGEELRFLLPLVSRDEVLTSGSHMLPMLDEGVLGNLYQTALVSAAGALDPHGGSGLEALSRSVRRGLAGWAESPLSVIWVRSAYRRALRRVGVDRRLASRPDRSAPPIVE